MRLPVLGLLSIALATSASPSSPPDERPTPRDPTPERSEMAPAPAPEAPAPPPAPAIREIEGPLPRALSFDVKAGDAGWTVRARHPKHLVALRRDDRRAAAATEASLAVSPGAAEVVWETTDLASLATARGVLHLDAPEGGGPPRVRAALAEAPVSAGRDVRSLHRCEALHDGAGGFTVLCRVDRVAYADNLAGADPHENVVVVGGERSVVRLDLPVDGARAALRADAPGSASLVDARVIGYASGDHGYVVRAEASLLPGEEKPSLALSFAERRQPVVPRPRRYCCRIPWNRLNDL